MNKKLKDALKIVQAAGIKITIREVKLKRRDIATINDVLTTSGRAVVSRKAAGGAVSVFSWESFKSLQKNAATARAAKTVVTHTSVVK